MRSLISAFGIGDAVDNPDSAALASQAGPDVFCDIEDCSIATDLARVVIVSKEVDDDQRDTAADVLGATTTIGILAQSLLHAQKTHERRLGTRMLRCRIERQCLAKLGVVFRPKRHDELAARMMHG